MTPWPWTFGVITDGSNPARLEQCVGSIVRESAVEDEIIVVGGTRQPYPSITWIPFDESIKDKWITKKKNIIAETSHYECLCIMHDYVSLMPGWRQGVNNLPYSTHGPDWLTATNKILNADNTRFRDWCVIYNDAWMNPPIDDQKPPYNINGHLLNYTNNTMGRWQYYSGAYFCVTKSILLNIPLNESRCWGQGEDVEWCRRLYREYGQEAFLFNASSTVKFLKQKDRAPWEGFSPI